MTTKVIVALALSALRGLALCHNVLLRTLLILGGCSSTMLEQQSLSHFRYDRVCKLATYL